MQPDELDFNEIVYKKPETTYSKKIRLRDLAQRGDFKSKEMNPKYKPAAVIGARG